MSKRPWMPLYVPDFLGDTLHLDRAQFGSYMLLCMHYWMKRGLPNDPAQLQRIARMSPEEWERDKPSILAFFDANLKHKRVEDELAKARVIASKRGAAADVRWSKPRSKNTTTETHANASQLQPQIPEPDGSGDPDWMLFDTGKKLLGKNAGGFIAKLKAACGGNVAAAQVHLETASRKENAREYIGGVIRTNANGYANGQQTPLRSAVDRAVARLTEPTDGSEPEPTAGRAQ